MTDKQALAYAKHELEYYKQVERDGIRMSQQIEYYKRVVAALKKQIPKKPTMYDNCGNVSATDRCAMCYEIIHAQHNHCPNCGQAILRESDNE